MNKIENYIWEDFDELGSTNDAAKEKSATVSGQNFIITTRKQTNGRGRRGRTWIGLEGNLFASLGLEFELRYLGQLSIVISLSLFETIKKLNPNVLVQTKWPNDILINHAKAIGVLIEKGEGDYLIIGIGVNVCNAPETKNLLYLSTSLKDTNIQIDRIEFLKLFMNIFNQNIHLLQTNGFENLREKWQANVYGLNKKIVVNMENEKLEGIFKGIDENGTLLLQTTEALKKVYAGDVFLIDEEKDARI
ncbi:MAG: biotin--[acetyl-CoA-carboxylase] ligase [Alphaproteobacteria bacterium]|nr:biotin--[acetyl-CoA-carboxylase] ligase [Alphaproteobacteria bacterium]